MVSKDFNVRRVQDETKAKYVCNYWKRFEYFFIDTSGIVLNGRHSHHHKNLMEVSN